MPHCPACDVARSSPDDLNAGFADDNDSDDEPLLAVAANMRATLPGILDGASTVRTNLEDRFQALRGPIPRRLADNLRHATSALSVEPAGGLQGRTARDRDSSFPVVGMAIDLTESPVHSPPKKIHRREQVVRGYHVPKEAPIEIPSDHDSPVSGARPCNNLAACGDFNVPPTEIYSDSQDEPP